MPDPTRYGRVLTALGERFFRLHEDELLLLSGAPWLGGAPSGDTVPLAEAHLLCPLAPRTIFGIGKNYRAHASEMGGSVPSEPLVFLKTVTSLAGPDDTVLLPRESARVDYEGELGVVIGRRGRRISRDQAMAHVFGLVPLCDITARDLQAKDGQWARAKGFDGFCPAGPFVVSGVSPESLGLSLTVGGMVKQRASTRDMVFDVPTLVAHLSSFATLEPGDVIATGTPEGVGPLEDGNSVEVEVERVGRLRFKVEREP